MTKRIGMVRGSLAVSFFFCMSGLAHAVVPDGDRGVDCLEDYATYIHKDLSGVDSELKNISDAVHNHFKNNHQDLATSTIRALVAGLPFGVAIVDNASAIISVFGLIQNSITFLRNEIRSHRYGATFELLSELHKLSESVSATAEVNLKKEDLDRLTNTALANMRSVNATIGLNAFKKIASTQQISADANLDLVRALMSEYLFGDLFCGSTDVFEPVDLTDVANFDFLKQHTDTSPKEEKGPGHVSPETAKAAPLPVADPVKNGTTPQTAKKT